MKKSGYFFYVIQTIILSAAATLYLAEYHRLWIRYCMQISTSGKLLFVGKNFYFPNLNMMIAIFSYVLVLWYLSIRQVYIQAMILILASVFLMGFVLSILSGLTGISLVAACTACDEGIRHISYGAIPYDTILLSSLMISLFPPFYYNLKPHLKFIKS